MEKDFWNVKTDQKKVSVIIGCVGILITFGMAVNSYKATEIQNGNELVKKEAGEGSYEQELIAKMDGMEKISLTVTVEERVLTRDEAEKVLDAVVPCLDEIVLGDNEDFNRVEKDLNFVSKIPETPVEVTWSFSEYFYSDGKIREDVEVTQPLELKIWAVLHCQEYTRDYEKNIVFFPPKRTMQNGLLALINESQTESAQSISIQLPAEYEGKAIVWRKPWDRTFLYFGFLTIGAMIFLRVGTKRDENVEKQKRLEELEKDYAQIVSKFSMLLTAGLSVRNAWERIVRMDRRRQGEKKFISEEMSWALREFQKGIPELEIYERFGTNVGLIHYKKLMAMFISHKKRGGAELLELMNQEMLLAWEEKKRKVRQQGEKIGTKLLIPMMGMLAIVFVMILVPAFLSFQL